MSSDLTSPVVRRSMGVLVQSEVMGEQLFGIAERHAHVPRDRQMWQALHALEEQTREAIFTRLGEEIDGFARSARIARAAGTASGAGLWLMPRRLQMQSVALGTKPFIAHFRRLEQHFAGSAHGPFFHYVLAHEYAIAELARRTLANADDALTPVENLLGAVPG